MIAPAPHPMPPVTGHALYWLVGALLAVIVLWVFAKAIQILDGVFDNEVDRFREQRAAAPHDKKKEKDES